MRFVNAQTYAFIDSDYILKNVPEYVEKVALRSWQSMSIGLYSNQYITRHKDKLVSVKNTNYEKNLIVICYFISLC